MSILYRCEINDKLVNENFELYIVSDDECIEQHENWILESSELGKILCESVLKRHTREYILHESIFEIIEVEAINSRVREYDISSTKKYDEDFRAKKRIVDVFLYYEFCSCERKKHNIECRRILLTPIDEDRNDVVVEVNYCKKCNKYFINEVSLKSYEEEYGLLLFRRRLDSGYKTRNSIVGQYNNLNEQSELASYGYNVKRNGMSKNDRHKLLYRLTKLNLMTKQEIKSHLEYLIRKREHMNHMEAAVEKWLEDLRYLNRVNTKVKPHTKGKIKQLK